MNIKQIGLIDRIFKPTQNHQLKPSSSINKVDQVNISSSALKRFKEGTDERVKEIVMNAPDIRLEKVNEVKAKISKSDYMSNIDTNILAENILQSPFRFDIKL